MPPVNRLARRRNVSLALSALAWLVLAVAAWLDPGVLALDWPLWAQIAGGILLGVFALNAVIILPVVALLSHVELRALDRLLRGEGVVARWQLTPEDWRAFLAADERLGGVNLLDRAMPCPPEGLAFVASRDALLIGEDFHHLAGPSHIGRVSWRDASPWMLEVQLVTPRGGSGRIGYHLVRFPIGTAYKAARDLHVALLYGAGLIGNAKAGERASTRRNRALAALLLGVLLAAVPMAIYGPSAALESNDTGPETLLLIPAIFLVAFGLGFALAFHLVVRRQAKLLAGAGVIGTWHMDPAAWRDFQAFDTIRRGREEVPWNLVDPARASGAVGVPITVAGEAVVIGDQFFHIPSFAAEGVTAVSWLDGRPTCVEIRGRYRARVGAFSRLPSPAGDFGDFVIRFPVAAGAEAVARRAVQTWRTRLQGR